MDYVATYGPWLALLLMGVSWAAKNLLPIYVKRDEAERQERREERKQLVELIKNNTEAMTHVATAVEVLSRDVGHLYTVLHLSRPSSPGEEKRVVE